MPLTGKKGLVLGIANRHSIAFGAAAAFRQAGATLAITYLNAKAEPFVRPLAESLDSPLIVPCDVREAGELDAVFDRIRNRWGGLDFVLTRSPMRPRRISTAASPTARKPASPWRWTSPATPSSAPPDWPSR